MTFLPKATEFAARVATGIGITTQPPMYSSTETLNFQAPEDALSNVLSEFYADADEVLASIQRRGVPMTLREPRKFKDGRDREPTKPYAQSTVQHMVQKLHKDIGLPTTSRSMLAGTVE